MTNRAIKGSRIDATSDEMILMVIIAFPPRCQSSNCLGRPALGLHGLFEGQYYPNAREKAIKKRKAGGQTASHCGKG
jgi:hypothetical protein